MIKRKKLRPFSLWQNPRSGKIIPLFKPIKLNTKQNITEISKNNLTWPQASLRYPRLKAFADSDKDGILNAWDCRPFNKKRHGVMASPGNISSGGMKHILPIDYVPVNNSQKSTQPVINEPTREVQPNTSPEPNKVTSPDKVIPREGISKPAPIAPLPTKTYPGNKILPGPKIPIPPQKSIPEKPVDDSIRKKRWPYPRIGKPDKHTMPLEYY